jgi:60 kDa SS-A/Ro ribonucleoprotein
MRVNVANKPSTKTHEDAPAWVANPERELRRAVLSCLLWEDQFYESGQEIATRIATLAAQVKPETVAQLACEARKVYNLRHAPLWLLCALAKTGSGKPGLVKDAVFNVVDRADEPGELLAMYWKAGKRPIPAQFKKGLAAALRKFDSYQLAKYDRQTAVKLRDVLFLTHAKPANEEQAELWRKLVANELQSPDTWEVALSAGKVKNKTFTRLLSEDKLGYLELLRNLRNMVGAGVDLDLIRRAILARKGAHRVFPFRYVAAARAAPQLEPELDQALCAAIGETPVMTGKTFVLVDVSGSMDDRLSGKSDMRRLEAAAALASIINGDLRVFTFSDSTVEVPPRRGMAGVDTVINSQPHSGTYLGHAVAHVNMQHHDRLIVITDEQSHDIVPQPYAKKAYMINCGSYKPSISYGAWTKIEGFSEGVLRYIQAVEAA